MRSVALLTAFVSLVPVAVSAQPAPDKVYDLKLTINEINILRTGLMELPAKQIVGVLNNVNHQVEEQNKPPVPETPPAGDPPK